MKGDDLVAQDVVTRRDGGGDLDHPGVVVLNELIVTPGSRDGRVVDEADGVDLEELERCLVDGRAVVAAIGEVGDHRTFRKGISILYADIRA